MAKNKKRPCIKGLKDFQKKGCPEKCWDRSTGEGCPAWKEYTIPAEAGRPPILLKDCVDNLNEYWQFEALKMLEGNQRAMESFRNGMCEEVDGKIHPKMDRATLRLISIVQDAQGKRMMQPQENILTKDTLVLNQVEI